jgi:hypothetical protein
MKYLITILVSVFFLSGCLGKWVSEAKSQEVCLMTHTRFLEDRVKFIQKMDLVLDERLEKFLTGVNKYRETVNKEPLKSDTLIVAELKDGRVAIALFLNKCFVPLSDYVTDLETMTRMLTLYDSVDILKGIRDAV